MSILAKHFALVNEQLAVQEKLARRFEPDSKGANEYRYSLHLSNVERLKQLASDLAAADMQLDNQPKLAHTGQPPILTLSIHEVADIPDELRNELSDSAIPDKFELAIVGVIEERGGIASLDQILVGIYRKTNEVLKRTTLNSRLYRMAAKNSLFPVPNKKGVYSMTKLTAEDAARIFGEEQGESGQLPLNDDIA